MRHKMLRQHRKSVESNVSFEVTEDRWGVKTLRASLGEFETCVGGLHTDRCVAKAKEKAAVIVRKQAEELS